MEKQSQDQTYRRQRGSRSGGRNRNSNRQDNQSRQGGNPSGARSRNRNRNRDRGGSRPSQPARQTVIQKILSILTFGWLGKPKPKGQAKGTRKPETASRTKSPSASATARNTEDASKHTPRNRSEVTSGRLYVGNLDYATGETELEELFNGVGNVLRAEVVTNPRTQQSKGFAFVEMGSVEEAKRAVGILDNQEFMGRKLIVSGARSETPNEDGGETSLAGSNSEVRA